MTTIQHLTYTDDERLKAICARYWQWDPVRNVYKFTMTYLAQEFATPTAKISKLAKEYSHGYSPELTCPECSKPLLFTDRNILADTARYKSSAICSKCTIDRIKREEKEKVEREKRYQLVIRQTFTQGPATITDVGALSFENAIYLLAMVRFTAEEDFSVLYPVEQVEKKTSLAPTTELSTEMVKSLVLSGVISVSPLSKPSGFIFKDDTEITSYHVLKVIYLPPCNSDGSTQKLIYQLERSLQDRNWSQSWHAESQVLWKKIALHECLQYLRLVLEEHDLPFKPGEKTIASIKTVLETYSVSQVFNIIWHAGVNAAAFYVREHTAKQHAANTVPGSMQNYADRAIANKWDIKKYRRPPSCPQSVVSEVLFNVALGNGDMGFDNPPGTGQVQP